MVRKRKKIKMILISNKKRDNKSYRFSKVSKAILTKESIKLKIFQNIR